MSEHKKEKQHFFEDQIIKTEDKFINAYMSEDLSKTKALRLLFKLYKGHYGRLLLGALIYIIKDSPMWALPLITANVINLVTNPPNNFWTQIIINAIIAGLLLIINTPLHTLYVKILSKANRNVEAGLRGAMVRKLQQLSISYHKDTQSGKIQSKVMRDVEVVTDLASHIMNTILGTVINLCITLVVIISNNIVIFFMFLLLIPAAVMLQKSFHKIMHTQTKAFRHELENTSAAVYDMEELIPVTRAHNLENTEVKKLTRAITKIAERGYRSDSTYSFFGALSWALVNLFQIACLFITVFMAFKKYISIGEISLYQTYFVSLSGHVMSIVYLLPAIARGADSIRSIGEILSSHDIEKNSDKPKLSELKGKYEFKNVVFNYDMETHVLNGLDLNVNEGETIALVGESGSGKSTIINLVTGFNLAESGQLLVDGQDIKNFDLRSYRRFLSVVPQHSILFSGTVRENITYGNDDYTDQQLAEAIHAAQLDDVIARLPHGLDTSVGEHGAKLSGGQRQRIAIARAIIRDPKVIIFDEATSALDSVTEREIQAAIDNLTRNRTTFVVAHRLSTIKNADKIAVIKDGRCVEFGTYNELIAKRGEFFAFKEIQS
ncbi:MAG: ABC transporter ATP-binding protein [Ruminococcaceae bacterium]|nr:ABC transporter ATP-binding protein [Oscillospiraceae bacterium]